MGYGLYIGGPGTCKTETVLQLARQTGRDLVRAKRYDFSGGQIENITRKQAVEEILTGCTTDIDRLVEFCDEEQLDNSTARPRIGY